MHFIYSASLSNTPSAVMLLRKQKLNPRMSRVRRNASSSLGPDGGVEWGNPALKGSGSKVASLLWTVHIKKKKKRKESLIRGDTAVRNSGQTSTFLLSPETFRAVWPCVCSIVHVAASMCELFAACSCFRVILHVCVCLIEGVYSAIAGGYSEPGPPCGSRGAAWTTRMEETRDNKPLE